MKEVYYGIKNMNLKGIRIYKRSFLKSEKQKIVKDDCSCELSISVGVNFKSNEWLYA